MVEYLGGYIWFIGLGGALIVLVIPLIYAQTRKQVPGGDANNAWKEEARDAHDDRIATPPAAE